MNTVVLPTRLSTTDADKGQAMMETIFMLPFLIVMIFFMYQAYLLVNKVQVVQKYLKSETIGRLLNRNVVTAENLTYKVDKEGVPPTDGSYYFSYDDFKGVRPAMMNYGLDTVTASLLAILDTKGRASAISQMLTKGQPGKQALGLCIGGNDVMDGQVSTKVFSISPGDTCKNK